MTEEYIVRMPPDMPYEIRGELNAWYIESEPIVRCRDCRYWVEDPRPIDPGWPMMCEDSGRDMVGPNDFCAWGERKEDGDD